MLAMLVFASFSALTTVPAVPVEREGSNGASRSSTNASNSVELDMEVIAGSWPEVHAGTWRTVPNNHKAVVVSKFDALAGSTGPHLQTDLHRIDAS